MFPEFLVDAGINTFTWQSRFEFSLINILHADTTLLLKANSHNAICSTICSIQLASYRVNAKIGPTLVNWVKETTLYKLYAVPVSICITRESYHQYPWVISSVPMRVCSTCDSYPQCLWGYVVPVSHILSIREDMQYTWVILDSFEQASEIKYPKLVPKIPEWFKSWIYWQAIWGRVWVWQCWRDWRWRQSTSQLCILFK